MQFRYKSITVRPTFESSYYSTLTEAKAKSEAATSAVINYESIARNLSLENWTIRLNYFGWMLSTNFGPLSFSVSMSLYCKTILLWTRKPFPVQINASVFILCPIRIRFKELSKQSRRHRRRRFVENRKNIRIWNLKLKVLSPFKSTKLYNRIWMQIWTTWRPTTVTLPGWESELPIPFWRFRLCS